MHPQSSDQDGRHSDSDGRDSDGHSSSEDEGADYLRRLHRYKAVARQKEQALVPEEESSEEDNPPMKPRLAETPLVCAKCLSPPPKLGSGGKTTKPSWKPFLSPRRPGTGPQTAGLRRPLSDPVSMFQQMAQTWSRDKFLSGGANRKEGRKLQLAQRNRGYGAAQ